MGQTQAIHSCNYRKVGSTSESCFVTRLFHKHTQNDNFLIEQRLSTLSSTEDIFDTHKAPYEKALKETWTHSLANQGWKGSKKDQKSCEPEIPKAKKIQEEKEA